MKKSFPLSRVYSLLESGPVVMVTTFHGLLVCPCDPVFPALAGKRPVAPNPSFEN